MLPPLLGLITSQPALLAEHAQAYAELAAIEGGRLAAAWRRQAQLHALALCALGVAIGLAGVALLLVAALPLAAMPAPWALWAVPLAPLALAVVCLALARSAPSPDAFGSLRRQLQADLRLLVDAGATP